MYLRNPEKQLKPTFIFSNPAHPAKPSSYFSIFSKPSFTQLNPAHNECFKTQLTQLNPAYNFSKPSLPS